MKDKQLFEGISAVKELDNETAATCIGGAVTLYENGRFNEGDDGRVRVINGSIRNLGPFNDITSSIRISSGRWTFYADEQYNQPLFTRGPGSYAVLPPGTNDRISSIRKVG